MTETPRPGSRDHAGPLECRGLTRRFEGAVAVDDVSLKFARGRIEALIGPNGAGKTTLFHLITGVIRPDAGSVVWKGARIEGWQPHRIARNGIGRLFQDVRVFESLSVLENVMVASSSAWSEHPLSAVALRRRLADVESAERERATECLALVGLEQRLAMDAGDLSFGQQKLLALARLLARGAEVLLLDEPTAGLNPAAVSSLQRLLFELARAGKTVVIIEHNLNVVLELSQWVYFMDEGRVVAFGLPDEVLGDPAVRATYLGL